MATLPFYKKRLQFLAQQGFRCEKVLDIGAYKGEWTQEFKKHFPNTSSTMVEPNVNHQIDLVSMAQENDRIVVKLLGSEKKTVDYYMTKLSNSRGNSIYKEQTSAFENCDIVQEDMDTIDNLFSEETFGFIKLDVQGAELDVLKGGKNVAQRAEFILLEVKILEYNKGAPTFAETIAYMDSIGFTPFDIYELHYLPSLHCNEIDILFVKKDSPYIPTGTLF